jgi:hypothetical protein
MSLVLVVLALAILAAALVVPAALDALRARRGLPARARSRGRGQERLTLADPGRERRAEARARELLRSCVNEEEWAMYRDLGFIRVFGRAGGARRERRGLAAGEAVAERSGDEDAGAAAAPAGEATPPAAEVDPRERPASPAPAPADRAAAKEPGYAYLLYPHKPVVAYEPGTHRLLSEYCVEFPDLSDAVTGARLPDSDDVLAKWMALTGDEARLLRDANMHLPGRQLDPGRVRRDLWRLGEWERRRRSAGTSSR